MFNVNIKLISALPPILIHQYLDAPSDLVSGDASGQLHARACVCACVCVYVRARTDAVERLCAVEKRVEVLSIAYHSVRHRCRSLVTARHSFRSYN